MNCGTSGVHIQIRRKVIVFLRLGCSQDIVVIRHSRHVVEVSRVRIYVTIQEPIKHCIENKMKRKGKEDRQVESTANPFN